MRFKYIFYKSVLLSTPLMRNPK